MLGRKSRSGVSEYGTGCTSCMRAFIVKVVYPGSGTSTSSPADRVICIARLSPWVAPIVAQTCSTSTWMSLSRASFATIA